MRLGTRRILLLTLALHACGAKDNPDQGTGTLLTATAPVCEVGPSPSAQVAAPVLAYTLVDRFHEAWLAAPAVADLDEDGTPEIIVARNHLLLVWQVTPGSVSREVWRGSTGGRIWSSPVVADLRPSIPGLEVAVASRSEIAAFDAQGNPLPGFPVKWRDELRSLATGDIDGDGALELVAVTTSPLSGGGQKDILVAFENDGSVVKGFPPNTSGTSGCDNMCFVTSGYDQNVALGDVDGDGRPDVFTTQDNAYLSLHDGTGRAFDVNTSYRNRKKFPGIRWMLDAELAEYGSPRNEATDLQAHFTNSAPAIADLDGDGTPELMALGSVQNAAQTNRELGVALFVSHADGTRPAAFRSPPRFTDYRSGLMDPGENIVAVTNSVAVADLDANAPGLEVVFAGFDGRIRAVSAAGATLWTQTYTNDASTWTGGVVLGDLSGDGVPEIVLTTYGPKGGDLMVFDANGAWLHTLPLGGRGAMPVPTLADVDADGDVDIVVSLKDAEDRERQVLVFEVPGSSTNCLPWPTARGNLRRDGWVPPTTGP